MESLSDYEARLYYRFYVGTQVGDKHLWSSSSWRKMMHSF